MANEPSNQFPYIVGAAFDIREDTSSNTSDENPTGQRSTLHQLKITGTIAIGPTRRSQLFLCQISPGTTQTRNKILVAKVWDPVYHPEPTGRGTRSPSEVATLRYNRERTAFERIAESEPPHQCTPRYHKSWSLQCPAAPSSAVGPSTRTRQKQKENPRIRTVPLILMEHIRGCCMQDLETRISGPDGCSIELCDEGYRLAVWARILEIESWLHHIGIEHNDILSRNFVVHPAPSLPDPSTAKYFTNPISLVQSQPCRVAIIDFDSSIFHSESQESKPQNPIDRYWSENVTHLPFWVPMWWTGDLPKRREWLVENFHLEGSKYYRRAPPDKARDRVNILSEDDEEMMTNLGYTPNKEKADFRV